MNSFEIKVFNSFSSELKKIWKSIDKEFSSTPFQSFDWLSNWYKIIGINNKNIELKIVVVSKNKETVLLLPFSVKNIFGIKILEWMSGYHSDYMLPLISSKLNIDEIKFLKLWNKILLEVGNLDIIYLEKQKKILTNNKHNPFVKYFNVEIHDYSSQIILDNSWNEFYNNKFDKKIKADSNRQYRRLKEIGQVEILFSNNVVDDNRIIDKMIYYKELRYKMMGVKNLLEKKENKKFYQLMPKFLNNNLFELHCSAFKVNNEIIAAHVGLIMNKTFYYLMPSNDFKVWKRFSTGRLLLEKLIEFSYGKNLKIFDLTIGSEGYKKKWLDKEEPLFRMIKPITLKGKYVIFLFKIFNRFKTTSLYNYLKHYYKKLKILSNE